MPRRWPKNRGSESWIEKHPGGPLAQGQGPAGSNAPASPAPTAPPQDFLPYNAAFESGVRSLSDLYNQQQMGYQTQMDQLQPAMNYQLAQLGTNQMYENRGLDESLADRGVFDSSINPYLRTRDIGIPYDRQRQALALQGTSDISNLTSQMGESQLGYNEQLANLYLQLAAQQAEDLPLELYQGTARRKPKKKPKKKPPKK